MAASESSNEPLQLEKGGRENDMPPDTTAHASAATPPTQVDSAGPADDGSDVQTTDQSKPTISPVHNTGSRATNNTSDSVSTDEIINNDNKNASELATEGEGKQDDSNAAQSNKDSSEQRTSSTHTSLQIQPLQLGQKQVDSNSTDSTGSEAKFDGTNKESKQDGAAPKDNDHTLMFKDDIHRNQVATTLAGDKHQPAVSHPANTDKPFNSKQSLFLDGESPTQDSAVGDSPLGSQKESRASDDGNKEARQVDAGDEREAALLHSKIDDDGDGEPVNEDEGDDESIIYEPRFIIGPDGQEVRIPVHPISSFQPAFEESIEENTFNPDARPYIRQLDGKARRELLLSQPRDDKPFDSTWRYRPGLQYHELIKLIAQIAFGVGLMFFGVANDTTTVVNILQQHIDDMDEFLEVSVEDQCLAIDDLMKRANYLKLLMGNMPAFEEFLEEEEFCQQILEGNEKLVLVLDRNAAAVRQWDDDIETGLKACGAFAKWLYENEEGEWRKGRADIADVFDAMKGNTQGWIKAFEDMNLRSGEANALVLDIMSMVGDIDLKAENVQRKRQGLGPRSEVRDSVASFTTRHQRGPTGRDGNGVERLKAKKALTKEADEAVAKHINLHYGVPEGSPRPQAPKPADAVEVEKAIKHIVDMEDNDDDGEMYPLPGGLPLLPPTRYPFRHGAASISSKSSQPGPDSAKLMSPERASIRSDRDSFRDSSLSPMYLLQPKTYSPLDPPTSSKKSHSDTGSTHKSGAASIASQSRSINDRDSESSSVTQDKQSRRKSHISSVVSQNRSTYGYDSEDGVDVVDIADMYASEDKYPVEDAPSTRPISKKSSLRSRISKPPEAISIPPRSPVQKAARVPSPGYAATPATTASNNNDSAYGSDIDVKFRQQRPRGRSSVDLSPPNIAGLVPSPHSEHQYYRPVNASPHSPLQQRPQTSAAENYHFMNDSSRQHVRNKLSNKSSKILGIPGTDIATSPSYDTRNGLTPTPESGRPFSPEQQHVVADNRHGADLNPSPVSAGPTLKKKKSTFGWFKKAFTMDESERAQFDQRRAAYQQEHERMMREQHAPRFLDGKRIR